MQMLGINGLIDIVAHAGGPGPPLVVLVLNNGDLNQVTWEQRVLAGDAKLEASQDLPPFDFAAYARGLGIEGIRVERPEHVGPAWDARARRRPAGAHRRGHRPRGAAAAAAHPARARPRDGERAPARRPGGGADRPPVAADKLRELVD